MAVTDMREEKLTKLKGLLAEANYMDRAVRVLAWDRETYLPEGGAESRANQLATLARMLHAASTSDEIGRLLEDLTSEESDLDPDSDEARLLLVEKRDYEMARKLPAELVEEVSRAGSEGLVAWHHAKEAKDYSLFVDALKRNAEVNRRVADAYGYADRPYDAFVQIFESGMTTAQLDTIFSELKEAIVPLVREIASRKDAVDDSCLKQYYDEEKQLRFGLEIAERFGYDLKRGRLDQSAHPFTMPVAVGDVRITTRILPNQLDDGLLSTLHEAGHAMYEQGVDPAFEGTPLSGGTSAGVHESQSRLWENLVGRSRPFQDFLFPRLQSTFPDQLGKLDVEAFYRAINKVQPSLVRTAADEVTYNLHIMLRYELENEMLEDKVDIGKLDTIWKERMEQYLGVVPQDDAEGVLQDIHWSTPGEYVFPGYTLGNMIGAQLFRRIRAEIPDLDGQMASGEFGQLLEWLRSNVYHHGRKFTSNELMQRITGEPVGTAAWIAYARDKFSAIYGI